MKKQMFSIVLLLSLFVTETTPSFSVYSTGARTILNNFLQRGSVSLSQGIIGGAAEEMGVTGQGYTMRPFHLENPAQIIVNVDNQKVTTPLGQRVGQVADSISNFVGSGLRVVQQKAYDIFDTLKTTGYAVRDFDYAQGYQGVKRMGYNGTQQLLDSAKNLGNAAAEKAATQLSDLQEGLGVAGQQLKHAADFTQNYVVDAVVNVPQAAQAGVGTLRDGFNAVAGLTVDGVRQAAQTAFFNPQETASAAFDAVKDAVVANPGRILFGAAGAYAGNRLAKNRGVVARTMATAAGALAANFVSEEIARIALVAGIAGKFVVTNVKARRAQGSIKDHERNVAMVNFVTDRILKPQDNKIQNGLNIVSAGHSVKDICDSPYKYDYFTGIEHPKFLQLKNNEQDNYKQQVKDEVAFLHTLPEELKTAIVAYMISLESYVKAVHEKGKKSTETKANYETAKRLKDQLKEALAPYQEAIRHYYESNQGVQGTIENYNRSIERCNS